MNPQDTPEQAQPLAEFARAGLVAPHLDDPLQPTDLSAPALGWGVVGPGAIAHRVVPEIALLPDARLVAVSSRDRQRAYAFAQRYGFDRHYWDGTTESFSTGVEALAADPDVDVVYVASPHGYHHEHLSVLLQAGKHVLCEKALAVTAAEVQDLIRLAREHRVLLMEAVWTAMTPGFRRAMALVGQGLIGQVRSVTGAIGFHAPADPTHRLFAPADGGGVTLDMLIYPLLWSDALQGQILEMCAMGHIGPTGVDDDLALQIRRERGWAQLSGTLHRMPAPGVTISGTEGWLRVDGRLHNPPHLQWLTSTMRSDDQDPVTEKITITGAGYVPQIREATRCIRQGLLESPFVPWSLSLSRAQFFDAVRTRIGLA